MLNANDNFDQKDTNKDVTEEKQLTPRNLAKDTWLNEIQCVLGNLKNISQKDGCLNKELTSINSDITELMNMLAEKQSEAERLKEELLRNNQEWDANQARLKELSQQNLMAS